MTVQKLILNPFNARSRPGNKDKNIILDYSKQKQILKEKVGQKTFLNSNLIDASIMLQFSSRLMFLFPYRRSSTNISSLRLVVLLWIFFTESKRLWQVSTVRSLMGWGGAGGAGSQIAGLLGWKKYQKLIVGGRGGWNSRGIWKNWKL